MNMLTILLGLVAVCFICWYFTISPESKTQYQHQDGSKSFNKPTRAMWRNELGWSRKTVITKSAKNAAAKEKRLALIGMVCSLAATAISALF